MGQITRETCRCILEAFERKDPDGGFPLTSWEKAQLAYAWLEREDARASPEVKQTPYGPAIRGDVLIDAERLHAAIKDHTADLRRCAEMLLREFPAMSATAQEFLKAARELEAAAMKQEPL